MAENHHLCWIPASSRKGGRNGSSRVYTHGRSKEPENRSYTDEDEDEAVRSAIGGILPLRRRSCRATVVELRPHRQTRSRHRHPRRAAKFVPDSSNGVRD